MKPEVRLVYGSVAITFLILMLASPLAAQTATCDTSVVQTLTGSVCGVQQKTSSGTRADAYLGIPYAESTAGSGRWAAPTPKQPWSGTRNASRSGPVCPQPGADPKVPQSEDCLSINVWTPAGAAAGARRRPVMVFIHGGGWITGSGSDALYNSAYLAANHDVLVVTFNYRLGILGFFAADSLEGNYAIRDQQLAIKWVNDNIAPFGGDPRQVTLFGESVGAVSVALHTLSVPTSQSYFRAAITESSLLGIPLPLPGEARLAGDLFKQLAGCQVLDCLRSKSAEQIVQLQTPYTGAEMQVITGWQGYNAITPFVDGSLIVAQPVEAAAAGRATKPMLMGTNLNEGNWFAGDIMMALGSNAFSLSAYLTFVAQKFEQGFERLAVAYGTPSSDNATRFAKMFTDFVFTCSNHRVAESVAQSGRPVYMYQFTQLSTFNLTGVPFCKDVVCHTNELPYVFNTAGNLGFSFTPSDVLVSTQMMRYWTNFAKTLDPNLPVKPQVAWPAFDRRTGSYLYLNGDLKTGVVPDAPCALFDTLSADPSRRGR